ncbi:unnamed protein product, partial [marine sediment metagenome]
GLNSPFNHAIRKPASILGQLGLSPPDEPALVAMS